MKKLFLLVIPFLFSVAIQGNVKEIIMPEKAVEKTVRFSIYASSNYSTSVYRQSKAKILLSIWKYKKNRPELVWSATVDAGKLKNYPSADEALFREVKVFNVKEHREQLIANYRVIYDNKGSELFFDKAYLVPVGDSMKKLFIAI
jgi:hypothetical protein